MAYVGNQPSGNFVQVTSQTITGNGGATYTLDRPAGNSAEIEVFVNHVRQDPASYTVTGTSLTLGGNITSSDSCYVVFQSAGVGTVSHPATNNLQAADGTFSGDISGQSLTATNGTFSGDLTVDTNTLHVDAANNRVGVGVAAPSQPLHLVTSSGAAYFLQDNGTANTYLGPDSANTGLFGTSTNHDTRFMTNNTERMRIHASGRVTMPYQPAFWTYLSSNTSKPSGTSVVPGGFTTKYNVGGHYSTSTKRFTAPVAGLYLFTGTVATVGGQGSFNYLSCEFWVNGGRQFIGGWQGNNSPSYSKSASSIVLSLSANDYVELACETNKTFTMQGGSSVYTYMSGYLLG